VRALRGRAADDIALLRAREGGKTRERESMPTVNGCGTHSVPAVKVAHTRARAGDWLSCGHTEGRPERALVRPIQLCASVAHCGATPSCPQPPPPVLPLLRSARRTQQQLLPSLETTGTAISAVSSLNFFQCSHRHPQRRRHRLRTDDEQHVFVF
jgi:hypothetical protein